MKRLLLTALAGLLATGAFAQQTLIASPQSVRVAPVPNTPNEMTVRVWTDSSTYRVGEDVRINYRASRDAYVLIFSTDANGETRQLLPNAYDSDNYVQGGQTYTIPNYGYRLEATPPTGRETISIVAFKERNRALDNYSSRKSEVFPKSDGPRAAVSRVIVKPEGERNRRYAEDSATIRVVSQWDNGNNRPGHGNNHERGRLTIKSDPSAAYVYINNEYRGITPLDLRDVRTGRYDIVLHRAGFYPVRKSVRVRDDERTRVDENLRPIRYSY